MSIQIPEPTWEEIEELKFPIWETESFAVSSVKDMGLAIIDKRDTMFDGPPISVEEALLLAEVIKVAATYWDEEDEGNDTE